MQRRSLRCWQGRPTQAARCGCVVLSPTQASGERNERTERHLVGGPAWISDHCASSCASFLSTRATVCWTPGADSVGRGTTSRSHCLVVGPPDFIDPSTHESGWVSAYC